MPLCCRAPSAECSLNNGLFPETDIERWMVKSYLGCRLQSNLKSTKLKPDMLDLLFANIEWPEGRGLYFSATSAKPMHHSAQFRDPSSMPIDTTAHFCWRLLSSAVSQPGLLCLGATTQQALDCSGQRAIDVNKHRAVSRKSVVRHGGLEATQSGVRRFTRSCWTPMMAQPPEPGRSGSEMVLIYSKTVNQLQPARLNVQDQGDIRAAHDCLQCGESLGVCAWPVLALPMPEWKLP